MNLYYTTAVLLFLSFQETAYMSLTEDFNNSSSENSVPCESGWYYYGEKCYKVEGYEGSNSSALSWGDARNRCTELDGYLVSILSDSENDFIRDLLASLNIKLTVHIGLLYRKEIPDFIWDDGSLQGYRAWDYGQPRFRHTLSHLYKQPSRNGRFGGSHLYDQPARDGPFGYLHEQTDGYRYRAGSIYIDRKQSAGDHCAEFLTDPYPERAGKWIDEKCDRKRPYICKKESNVSLSSPDPRFCSPEEGVGVRFQDFCYSTINEKMSWDDAEKYCQQFTNGHLVKIIDTAHDTFLNSQLAQTNNRVWIGIKIQDKYQPKWSSGLHVVLDYFDVPSEKLEVGMCILRWKKHEWTPTSCEENFPFICEMSQANNSFSTLPSQISRCPHQNQYWKDLGGNFCYHIETKGTLSFFDAQYECIKKGGLLASIISKEEEDILSPYINISPEFYIGLNSLYTSGITFLWSDGSHANYTHWDSNEPSSLVEKCVELRAADMTWNDILCHLQKAYICQVEKVRFSTEEEAVEFEESETSNESNSTEDNETETAEEESKATSDNPGTAPKNTEAIKKNTGNITHSFYTFTDEKKITKTKTEEISNPVSLSAWYVLCFALLFLGVTFAISMYISRKWLKKKLEQTQTVQFIKSRTYNKFQNAEFAEVGINCKEEAFH